MTIRSDPLGPASSAYPVSEYHLPIADPDDSVDTVRIEKLALKPVLTLPPQPFPISSPLKESSPSPLSSPSSPGLENNVNDGKPLTYDAAVQFAIAGRSWPLRLSYDVAFVAAHPCMRGPHPLFDDYVYHAVPVDEILSIKDWGGINAHGQAGDTSLKSSESGLGSGPSLGLPGGTPGESKSGEEREENERERVLVVEAFGVADNEVLARAWCSHWGLGAVIADVERTCMACAIREAYAACLNVVVLVDGRNYDLD